MTMAGAQPLPPAAPVVTRTVRFIYARGLGAPDCPDVETVRAGVSARLGYEPFDEQAKGLVSATVDKPGDQGALEARIEIKDAAGVVTAERVLTSRRSDCAELAASMELAISIAIDPAGGARPRPPAPPETVPPPVPNPPEAPTVPPFVPPLPVAVPVMRDRLGSLVTVEAAPARPRRPPPAVQVMAGVVGAIGAAPTATFGATLQVSARQGSLSLAAEGRGDAPSSMPLRMGHIRTSLLVGSLVPCLHRWRLGGCLVVSAGTIRAAGEGLVDSRQVSAPYVAAGGRLTFDFAVVGPVVARLYADLSAPLTETVLRVSDEAVWTTPPVVASLGLSAGLHFP